MTQEEKELLLKDIFSRLPYGVICADIHPDEKFTNKWYIFSYNGFFGNFVQVCLSNCEKTYGYKTSIERIKPYLFPLTSMTEEQCYEFYCRFVENDTYYNDFKEYYFDNGLWHKVLTSIDYCSEVIDWFNKNNIDYRGLIPMGSAIDATGLNIY